VPKGRSQFTGGAYCNGEFLTELTLRRGWRAEERDGWSFVRHVTGGATTREPTQKLETAWSVDFYFRILVIFCSKHWLACKAGMSNRFQLRPRFRVQ